MVDVTNTTYESEEPVLVQPLEADNEMIFEEPVAEDKRPDRPGHHHPRRPPPADPEEVVLAAAAIALTVAKGKSIDDLQTLINLFSTATSLLDTILKQRLINKAFDPPVLGVDLSVDG